MAFLSSLAALMSDVTVEASRSFWVILIDFFRGFITHYGWCVIVFTIALRLLMLPLDFYQKKVAHDNKKKTEAMEPYMEKLRKQYGNDRLAMSAKQRELQKKFKINSFGPCLPAILSLVIFITLFGGFREIADFEIYTAYNDTRNAYIASYIADTDDKFAEIEALYKAELTKYEQASGDAALPAAQKIDLTLEKFKAFVAAEDVKGSWALKNDNTDIQDLLGKMYNPDNEIPDMENRLYDALLKSIAQSAAVTEYAAHKDSMQFLWIKNMWRPDALWGMNGCFGFSIIRPVPDGGQYVASLTTGIVTEYKKQEGIATEYNLVMHKVMAEYNKTQTGKDVFNGYYILAVLIVALSILSTKFNAAGNPAAAPQAATGQGQPGMPNMKMMMFIMPIMMGIFAISSNSAFSLYMVASTSMSLLSTVLCTFVIKMMDKKKTAKAEENKFQRFGK